MCDDDKALVLVAPDQMAALGRGLADLQDVLQRTRFIENAVRRFPFFTPRDRAPLTILQASPPYSADPAIAGGDLVADGSELILAEYEVPEHRMGEVYQIDVTARVIGALGAAQTLSVFAKAIPPSGSAARTIRLQSFLGGAVGTVATLSVIGSHWYVPRWRVQVVASLSAGAGAARAHGSISALEYNLGGD